MVESYVEAVDNLELLLRKTEHFLSEDDLAYLSWNLFYLKLQPQYGVKPVVQ